VLELGAREEERKELDIGGGGKWGEQAIVEYEADEVDR
jgi:hypothetical protein